MESSGQCTDNEENEANTEATPRSTKYQAKSQGEPSGRAQYKHVFFWDKVLSLFWLYTNFAFNSVTKRNVLNGKTILRKFWIVSCNLLVAFEVLKSILLMLNVILWSQIYSPPPFRHTTLLQISTLNLQKLVEGLEDEMLIFWAGGGQTQTL